MTTKMKFEIEKILEGYLEVAREQMVPTARFVEDLYADLLGIIEIVLAVEETFQIEIDDEAVEKILTVGDLFKCVEERVGRA